MHQRQSISAEESLEYKDQTSTQWTCASGVSVPMYLGGPYPQRNRSVNRGNGALNAVYIGTASGTTRSTLPEGTEFCPYVPSLHSSISVDAVYCRYLTLHCAHMGVWCSGFVLSIRDVIRLLFSNPTFARFAGTRTRAMLDSALYASIDSAHDGAISALASSDGTASADVGVGEHGSGLVAANEPAHEDLLPVERQESDDAAHLNPVQDTDPSDEVMTGDGDTLVLLFGVFVDGVQLHTTAKDTTTVVSLKCIDLPGFLVGTNVASYNLAFISGPKEPTCLTDFMSLILHQFKEVEPKITRDAGGVHLTQTDVCNIHIQTGRNCS